VHWAKRDAARSAAAAAAVVDSAPDANASVPSGARDVNGDGTAHSAHTRQHRHRRAFTWADSVLRQLDDAERDAPEPAATQCDGELTLAEQGVVVPMHSVLVQLLENTPITQVHQLFITNRLQVAFVTDRGRLVGVVSRKSLKAAINTPTAYRGRAARAAAAAAALASVAVTSSDDDAIGRPSAASSSAPRMRGGSGARVSHDSRRSLDNIALFGPDSAPVEQRVPLSVLEPGGPMYGRSRPASSSLAQLPTLPSGALPLADLAPPPSRASLSGNGGGGGDAFVVSALATRAEP
jgi:CBS domain-containing protein